MSLGRIASYEYGIVKSIFITILTYIVVFATLIHACSLLAAAKPVTDGLVGHWSFDELKGEVVRDSSGNNDGIIKGDLEIAEGQVGGALRFDGLDDYVDLDNGDGTVNDFIDGSSGVTVTVWINPDEFSAIEYNNNVFTIWINSSHWGFSIHIEGADGNKARIGGRSQESDKWQDVTGISAIPTGEWSHVAGVLDFARRMDRCIAL